MGRKTLADYAGKRRIKVGDTIAHLLPGGTGGKVEAVFGNGIHTGHVFYRCKDTGVCTMVASKWVEVVEQ